MTISVAVSRELVYIRNRLSLSAGRLCSVFEMNYLTKRSMVKIMNAVRAGALPPCGSGMKVSLWCQRNLRNGENAVTERRTLISEVLQQCKHVFRIAVVTS